jgi:hypothetical protein
VLSFFHTDTKETSTEKILPQTWASNKEAWNDPPKRMEDYRVEIE